MKLCILCITLYRRCKKSEAPRNRSPQAQAHRASYGCGNFSSIHAAKDYARIPTTRTRPRVKFRANRRRKEKYVTQQPMQHNSVTGLDSEAEHSKLQRGLSYRHIQLIAIGGAIGTGLFLGSATVSYTHLDVYKRQATSCPRTSRPRSRAMSTS